MKKLQTIPVFIAILLIFSSLSGCVGLNSFPLAARGGDTVLFAVGTPEGMTRNNISVTFTSDVDSSITDITKDIRSLSKFYPAKTSDMALNNSNAIYIAGHEPWLSVLSIDLPLSIPDGGPIPVGTGTVSVQCIPRTDCTFPGFFPHVNDIGITLEILPGTGNPHPFDYAFGSTGSFPADPALLDEQQQVTVRPDANGSNTSTRYGAAEFVISMPVTTYNGGTVPDSDIVVIAEDLTTLTGSQRNVIWKRSGDNFTVIFSAPNGMKFNEFRFSLVMKAPVQTTDPAHIYTTAPTLISENYYGLDGSVIPPTASPTIVLALDYTQ